MPEIIRRGHDTLTATCHRCGCHFRYALTEVRRYSWTGSGTVACPQCSAEYTHPYQRDTHAR